MLPFKSALVTGGAGFIGSHLIDGLVLRGCKVESWDDYSTGQPGNFLPPRKEVIPVFVNCAESVSLRPGLQPDIIFHLAAESRIVPSVVEPKQALKTNYLSTLNMLDLARRLEVPFVFFSSCTAVRHTPHHKNAYALSKWQGEQLCHLYRTQYNVPTIIIRPFNVFGPRQMDSGMHGTVVGIFEKAVREGRKMKVVGDGSKVRDYIHVTDVVRATLAAVSAYRDATNPIYDVGTSIGTAVIAVARLLARKDQKTEDQIEYAEDRPFEEPTSVANSAYWPDGWQPDPLLCLPVYAEEFHQRLSNGRSATKESKDE